MRNIGRAAILFLALACMASCARKTIDGRNYILGLYHSDSDQAFDATQEAFGKWLLARGLTLHPSPAGLSGKTGTHSEGDEHTWYQMQVGGNHLLLCITTNQKNYREITATMEDDGTYTPDELKEMHARSLKLWLEMIAWFETNADAQGNVLPRQVEGWFVKARAGIGRVYRD